MSDETSSGDFTRLYVQARNTVIHGAPKPGSVVKPVFKPSPGMLGPAHGAGPGVVKTTYRPGDEIPAGLLEPEEVARLLARGVVGPKPPIPYSAATAPNPAGVGLRPGADVGGIIAGGRTG